MKFLFSCYRLFGVAGMLLSVLFNMSKMTLNKMSSVVIVFDHVIISETDDAMDEEDRDSRMGKWFELVQQKNELVREESYLMYK